MTMTTSNRRKARSSRTNGQRLTLTDPFFVGKKDSTGDRRREETVAFDDFSGKEQFLAHFISQRCLLRREIHLHRASLGSTSVLISLHVC